MSKNVSIAIIGGGASGTLTALNLLRKLNVPAQIWLIEKRNEAVYRGNAYSSRLNYEPLNVPAGRMSAFSHLPDDFFYWLKKKKQADADFDIIRESFVSRRWYGDYLTERVGNAAAQSSHIGFETLIDHALDIRFDGRKDAYCITLNSGNNLHANYLVFATGNEPPVDIFKQEEVEGLNCQYVSNPWTEDPLQRINEQENVLIIGTGLTMVDHVVSLNKRGHKGKIFCFSRHGYLPLPHAETSQNFVFEFNDQQKDLPHIFSEVKRNIDNANGKNIQWQNALDAMRGKTGRMWKMMSLDSKRLFLNRLKSIWEIHRHRMPLASSETLKEMEKPGQLEILSGKVTGINRNKGNVIFKFISRTSKEERSIKVQRIINCTGPSGDYFKTDNTLLKNLLGKGWMKQDDLKIGIVTGARGEIIQENGVVLQNAFAIGPLRKATEWETTAIREIRTQAEDTATQISSRVELNHEVMVEIGL